MAWLLVPDGLVWVFLYLLFHKSLQFIVQKTKNILWAAVLRKETPCWWESLTENGQTGSSWQKGNSNCNSDNRTAQLWWAEKLLRMHNTSNLEEGRLQQQKTTSGSTSVSQEQKAEAAVGTGSPKLDSWRLEKRSMLRWMSISPEAYRW